MDSTTKNIAGIIRRNVEDDASVSERLRQDDLSPFLQSSFDLYDVDTTDGSFIVAASVEPSYNLLSLRKQAAHIQNALDAPIVLYLPALSAAQRKAFIKARQGFVTSTGDMYLPHLALVLGKAARDKMTLDDTFNPAEQMLFLFCLYHDDSPIRQAEVVEHTGVSAASVSRAFKTFCALRLLDFEVGGLTGKLHSYRVCDKSVYYREGITRFGDPVMSRFLVNLRGTSEGFLFGGLSALSELSNLTLPERTVLAVGKNDRGKIHETLAGDEADSFGYEVQVLRYDPQPLAEMCYKQPKCVDPITMLKTLGESDERISIAIRDVMGRYEWYSE